MQPRSTLPVGIAILACGLFAAGAYAAPVTTSLFYTTIAGPPDNVGVAVVTLSGSTLAIDSNTALASVNGAAGIVIAPDGNLLIGGQSQGFGGGASPAVLHEITRTGVFVGDGILPPGNGAYHLALGSTTPVGLFLRALCNAPTGGCGPNFTRFSMSNKPITGQTGISFEMAGPPGADLEVTGLAFDTANHTWYYGATPSGSTTGQCGSNTFGEGGGELVPFPFPCPGYDVLYDRFSNTVIFDSGDTVAQFDPATGAFVSAITISGEEFDQAAVDGKGHLFVASHTGDLLGVDYEAAAGHLINGAGATRAVAFLAPDLGGLASPAPEPASLSLLGVGLAGLIVIRRRRSKA